VVAGTRLTAMFLGQRDRARRCRVEPLLRASVFDVV
jgi:hypothetical protein